MKKKIATYVLAALSTLGAASLSYAAPGDLDTSFGNGGMVMNSVGDDFDAIYETLVQNDQKILVVGYVSRTFAILDLVIARYNQNGSLDSSFASNGILIIPNSTETFVTAGTQNGGLELFASRSQQPLMAIASDGKIIIANIYSAGYGSPTTHIRRINPDGTIDTSFGTNGIVNTNIYYPRSLRLLADDTIQIYSAADDGYDVSRGSIVRFTPSGQADTTFGNNSVINFELERGEMIQDIKSDENGNILLGGKLGNNNIMIVRLNADGSRDPSFGNNGRTIYNGVGHFIFSRLYVQSDGKPILVIQGWGETNRNFIMLRFTREGHLDTSFGTNGTTTTSFSIPVSRVAITSISARSYGNILIFQPNGKIILGGFIQYPYENSNYGETSDFALARYTSNGVLDNSFGNAGVVTANISPQSDTVYALTIQSDCKIIAAGHGARNPEYGNSGNFALARFQNDGCPQPQIIPPILIRPPEKDYIEPTPVIKNKTIIEKIQPISTEKEAPKVQPSWYEKIMNFVK